MHRQKFYYGAIAALILLNLGLMAALWMAPRLAGIGGPFPGGPPHLKHFMSKALKLDAKQRAQLDRLADTHRQEMERLQFEHKQLLEAYFHTLVQEDSETADKLLRKIGQTEEQKVQLTYQHFRDIKRMLRTDQLKAFPRLMDEAMKRLLLKPKRKDPPPPPHRPR